MLKEDALDKIQGIIRDFKIQSFAIKGFSLTFLGLLIQPYYEKPKLLIGIVYLVAIIIFWFLDTYYLRMENIYRKIEQEINITDKNKGITLDYKDYPKLKKEVCYISVALSKTILPIYFIQIILIISIYLIK